MHLLQAGEEQFRVSLTPDLLPGAVTIRTHRGVELEIKPAPGEGYLLPGWYLYTLPQGFPVAGYAPTLDRWVDPIAFLREHGAEQSAVPYLYVTPTEIRPDRRSNILDEPAPAWSVTEWIRPAAKPPLEPPDLAGKVVVVICFDTHCRGSQTHGLPALEELARHFHADPDVTVVGLQTVITNNRRNNAEKLKQLAVQIPSVERLGFCEGGKTLPPIIDKYQICGTPWVILIDRDGKVQLSNFVIRPEEVVRRVEELKDKAGSSVPAAPVEASDLTN